MSLTLLSKLSTKIAGDDARLRRGLDLILAGFGLLTLTPVFALVAVAVKGSSSGPVFYRARRVGQGGRLFHLLKFRTMVLEADQHGPGLTVAGDPRVTPLGRWLRQTKIDELPQLINVVRGDMSLVGPRPEDPRYVQYYTSEQQRVLTVLPGVTSPASVRYRSEERLLAGPDWETVYITQILPDKLQLELAYLQQRTLMSDLRIILGTLLSIIWPHRSAQ